MELPADFLSLRRGSVIGALTIGVVVKCNLSPSKLAWHLSSQTNLDSFSSSS